MYRNRNESKIRDFDWCSFITFFSCTYNVFFYRILFDDFVLMLRVYKQGKHTVTLDMHYLNADFETSKFDIFFVRWNFNLLKLLLLVRLMAEQLTCVLFVCVVWWEVWSRVALTLVAGLAAARFACYFLSFSFYPHNPQFCKF